MSKEGQPIQDMDEKPAYLIVADNVALINREHATDDDLFNVVDGCSSSKGLWFRLTYNLFGEEKTIHPRKFVETRAMTDEERDEFVKITTQELIWAENIKLVIIDPDRADLEKKY